MCDHTTARTCLVQKTKKTPNMDPRDEKVYLPTLMFDFDIFHGKLVGNFSVAWIPWEGKLLDFLHLNDPGMSGDMSLTCSPPYKEELL